MKSVTYTFNPWNYSEFSRTWGHMLVDAHVVPSGGKPTKIQFVFDSGAYITVLTRLSAHRIGLPVTGEYTANLTGFNKERGSDKAEIVVAPRIEIGKHIDVEKYFVHIGRADELGSGVRNLYEFTRIYTNGGEPELIEGDVFKIIVPIALQEDKAQIKVDLKVDRQPLNRTLNENAVLDYIKNHPQATLEEIADATGRTLYAIKLRLSS